MIKTNSQYNIPKSFGIFKGIIFTSLFLLYPYLVYRGIENGTTWLAPVIFSALCCYRALSAQQVRTRILYVLFALVLLFGAYYLQTITAKILPVLVQLMLMFLFGRTLMADHGPSFIERFVRLQYPEFPSVVSQYCRLLTQIWTAFFAFNALLCTGLAIWGSEYWWALYNGMLIYLMMGLLSSAEYIYRRRRFADLSILHQGIPDLMTTVKRCWLMVEKYI